jgi:cell shape-determining protein MreC
MRKFILKKGLINTIVLIVIALIVLGFFNIDLKTILAGPVVKENLTYAWQLAVDGLVALKNTVLNFIGGHIPS